MCCIYVLLQYYVQHLYILGLVWSVTLTSPLVAYSARDTRDHMMDRVRKNKTIKISQKTLCCVGVCEIID
jgi:hypothetical protein